MLQNFQLFSRNYTSCSISVLNDSTLNNNGNKIKMTDYSLRDRISHYHLTFYWFVQGKKNTSAKKNFANVEVYARLH